jgi:hypothetical protein
LPVNHDLLTSPSQLPGGARVDVFGVIK